MAQYTTTGYRALVKIGQRNRQMSQNTSHAVMSQRSEPNDSRDYFPTPPWATRALVEHVLGGGIRLSEKTVLEPSCGDGHMSKVLEEYSTQVTSSDIHPYGYGDDVVVVYKIDRLSRSLTDFTKLVEVFDQHSVTFVSVTQAFNTTTSMGRLTLNILLSFAQFEREVTAERIRDKVAASRKKGMWMGGPVPYGYKVVDKKLVVNETEAENVRWISARFTELGSCTELARELATRGVRNRRGNRVDKKSLYRMLNNRVYLGEAVHKGESYPGEHDAIIDRETWDEVHAILQESPRKRAARTRADTPALLKGLLFGPDGAAFSPTHTRKGGKLYRYYVSQAVLKHGAGSCPVGRVPAGEIETAVIDQLRIVFRQPEIVAGTCKATREREPDFAEIDARAALQQLEPLWDELFPAEQARIVALLVERIDIGTEALQVRLRVDGLNDLSRGLEIYNQARSIT